MATLLHCTDFHGNAAWFAWLRTVAPDFDGVVLSGDLVDEFQPPARVAAQAAKATAFLRSFARPIFLVSGNHDGLVDLAAIARDNPLVRIDGCDEEHFGWRLVCVGWRGAPAVLSASEQDGSVLLVSHQPPDELAVSQDRRGDWGGYDVRALAATLPAGSVVLSGHIHSPRNWHARVGPTAAFNPGMAPANSKVPRHVVLDLAKRRARLVGGPPQDGQDVVAF